MSKHIVAETTICDAEELAYVSEDIIQAELKTMARRNIIRCRLGEHVRKEVHRASGKPVRLFIGAGLAAELPDTLYGSIDGIPVALDPLLGVWNMALNLYMNALRRS